MNLSTKQKHTHREQTHGYQGEDWREGASGKDWREGTSGEDRREGASGEDWREGTAGEFGLDMYTRLYLKRITSKGLRDSTGNSAQCCVAAWMGAEFGENGHMYG